MSSLIKGFTKLLRRLTVQSSRKATHTLAWWIKQPLQRHLHRQKESFLILQQLLLPRFLGRYRQLLNTPRTPSHRLAANENSKKLKSTSAHNRRQRRHRRAPPISLTGWFRFCKDGFVVVLTLKEFQKVFAAGITLNHTVLRVIVLPPMSFRYTGSCKAFSRKLPWASLRGPWAPAK